MPEAAPSLSQPERSQVYESLPHVVSERKSESKVYPAWHSTCVNFHNLYWLILSVLCMLYYLHRLDVQAPICVNQATQPKRAAAAIYIPTRVLSASIVLVVPSQAQAPSMQLWMDHQAVKASPLAPPCRPMMPIRSLRPCGVYQVPQFL